ncbi:MAG: PaaI family thioesterase [Clostridiales bacterium]|nr:PaaI family thioesterase [Clostridiales bacterium]
MTQEYLSWLHEYYKKINQTNILENFLGLELVELQKGKSIYKIKTSQKHSNMFGTVHGGTLASICDIAMGTACITMGNGVVTIDMSVSYIKSAPKESNLTAIGEVISNGKTIMRAVSEIFDEQGQLIVKSQASYYVTGDFRVDD